MKQCLIGAQSEDAPALKKTFDDKSYNKEIFRETGKRNFLGSNTIKTAM
jgi:hypothetical protein